MNPPMSVMMATYRHEKYILEAIKSVPDWAVLHVSAVASDECTGKILAECGRKRLRKSLTLFPNIWLQKDMGIESVKLMLDGDRREHLVCRLDSDDVYVDGWLEKGFKAAREIIDKGKVPIVGPSFRLVDEKLNALRETRHGKSPRGDYIESRIRDVILPEYSLDKMLEGCIIPEYAITTIGALTGVGGYFSEDYPRDIPDRYRWYAMMLRVLKKYDCEVRLLPDIGFLYRQHRCQAHKRFTSRWGSKKNVENQKKVAEYYFPEGA